MQDSYSTLTQGIANGLTLNQSSQKLNCAVCNTKTIFYLDTKPLPYAVCPDCLDLIEDDLAERRAA